MAAINISYAQAMEDIHLLRALQGVPPEEGFYIDVGANDPEADSVTKLFYDMGWRGINVEASPTWFARLQQARPRDVNLEVAVSDVAGEIPFFDHAEGGLGTTVESIAESHGITSQIAMPPRMVKTATLAAICEAHAPGAIHFLKIDVEGAELAALRSMDFARFRPWVLCIECHYPNRPDLQTFGEWDGLVTAAGYAFAYTDTINRYYVAREHEHRLASFAFPAAFYVHANVARRMRDLEQRVRALDTALTAIKSIAGAL